MASWLTSTPLQVCRQLAKPLSLVLFPAAVLLRAGEWWCLLISADVGSSHVWPKPPQTIWNESRKIRVCPILSHNHSAPLRLLSPHISQPSCNCSVALGWRLSPQRYLQTAALAARAKVWEIQDPVSNATLELSLIKCQVCLRCLKWVQKHQNSHTSALDICEQLSSHPSIYPLLFASRIISAGVFLGINWEEKAG